MAEAKAIFAFRSQFSEFDTVPDADIAWALDTAALWIDKAIWSTTDWPAAVSYWAAHILSLKQMQLASTEVAGTGAVDLFLRMISFGERRIVFGERRAAQSTGTKGPGEELLDYTIYGSMYKMLRARNVIPVAIV